MVKAVDFGLGEPIKSALQESELNPVRCRLADLLRPGFDYTGGAANKTRKTTKWSIATLSDSNFR